MKRIKLREWSSCWVPSVQWRWLLVLTSATLACLVCKIWNEVLRHEKLSLLNLSRLVHFLRRKHHLPGTPEGSSTRPIALIITCTCSVVLSKVLIVFVLRWLTSSSTSCTNNLLEVSRPHLAYIHWVPSIQVIVDVHVCGLPGWGEELTDRWDTSYVAVTACDWSYICVFLSEYFACEKHLLGQILCADLFRLLIEIVPVEVRSGLEVFS